MDLIKFAGRQGEPIDALLARFDETVSRAAEDGMLQLTPSHTAAMILGAAGTTPDQLTRLLEPTGGILPQTDPELTAMRTRLRRMGHVLENFPHDRAGKMNRMSTTQQHYMVSEADSRQQGSSEQQWAG